MIWIKFLFNKSQTIRPSHLMDTVRNLYDPLYYTMVRPLKKILKLKKNHCHDQVHTINITIINELISDLCILMSYVGF